MIGIYKIENLINGKVYIGQSTDIKDRWHRHKLYAKKQYSNDGKRYYQHLYNAMRKYGLNNFSFEVLEETSEEELDDAAIRLCCKGERFSAGNYRFSYHKQPLIFTAKRHSTTPLYKIDTNNFNKITYYRSIKEAATDNNCCESTIHHRLKDNKKTCSGLYWKYVDENYNPKIEKYLFIDNEKINE